MATVKDRSGNSPIDYRKDTKVDTIVLCFMTNAGTASPTVEGGLTYEQIG
jgi:hypothetical protein